MGKYIQFVGTGPADAAEPAGYPSSARFLSEIRGLPGVRQVCANFVLPGGAVEGAHIEDTAPPPAFSQINAIWTDDEDGSAMPAASAVGKAAGSVQFAVEEHDSEAALLGSAKPPLGDPEQVKMICVIRRRPGMTRNDFIHYYETGHSRLTALHLPMIAGYRRNYPLPGEPVDFDVVTEMWFRNARDHQALLTALSDPALGAMFAEDEARLFDRGAIQMFLVREHGVA